MELMKLDVGHVIHDQSEMLPDVLNAAQQQLIRVQQLAELREKQLLKVSRIWVIVTAMDNLLSSSDKETLIVRMSLHTDSAWHVLRRSYLIFFLKFKTELQLNFCRNKL